MSVYLALLRGGIQEEASKGVQISRAKRVVIVSGWFLSIGLAALDPYHRNQPAIVMTTTRLETDECPTFSFRGKTKRRSSWFSGDIRRPCEGDK